MEDLVLRTAGSLLFIIALMLGLAWVVKKFLFGGKIPGASGNGVEVIAHVPLQPKRSIFIVRVPGKILVVGSAENGLTSLGELSDQPAIEQFDAFALGAQKPSQRFADIFKKFLHTN